MTKGQASPTSPADWQDSKLTPHGPGVPALQPASLALGSGAGFIGRGYYGDPKQLTALIIEGIQYDGFAFIQALSQCVTYVPDQKLWKERVHTFDSSDVTDPVQTAADIQRDDGFGLGLIHKVEQHAWEPEMEHPKDEASRITEITHDFMIS